MVENSVSPKVALLESILVKSSESNILNTLQVLVPAKECCRSQYKCLEDSDYLNIALITQSNKKIWQKERQFRITGSRCYSLYTYSKGDWKTKAQKYFWPKSFTNK